MYYYFQYTEPSGSLRQIYVGPDTEAVRRLVADQQSNPNQRRQNLVGLARSAAALGCHPGLPAHIRVIERLADYGFFRAGCMLIGTHAFSAINNMMGVRWKESPHTQDVDFAHACANISIALPGAILGSMHTPPSNRFLKGFCR